MPNVERSEKLESYLQRVRQGLHGLPSQEVSEIVQELRSHVLDRADGNLGDTNIQTLLTRLGDPQQVAQTNREMRASSQAMTEITPSRNIRSIATQLAMGIERSLAIILSIPVSIVGYGFAVCRLFTAILKPFAPNRVGLWLLPDPSGDLSLSLGRHGAQVAGHDLLGWWIIPIGMAIGIGVGLLTYRWDVHIVRTWPRRRASFSGVNR